MHHRCGQRFAEHLTFGEAGPSADELIEVCRISSASVLARVGPKVECSDAVASEVEHEGQDVIGVNRQPRLGAPGEDDALTPCVRRCIA